MFALKKMLLNACEVPNVYNGFKDATLAGGGMLKKLKSEYAQALTELGRDANLQVLPSQDLKSALLDKHYHLLLTEEERSSIAQILSMESGDKVKPTTIMSKCSDH